MGKFAKAITINIVSLTSHCFPIFKLKLIYKNLHAFYLSYNCNNLKFYPD